MTTQKKLIPKFSTPSEQTRHIDGQPVTVRRLPAKRATAVMSRLFTDVGSVVAEMLSSPERELDPAVEDVIRLMIASKAGLDAAVEISIKAIKAILFSNALSQVKNLDVAWLSRELIEGCVWIGDVKIDSMDELDDSGIVPRVMLELLWFACEVNFLPFSAGRVTKDGPVDQVPTGTRTGTSSLRGDRDSVGRTDQTSAAMA